MLFSLAEFRARPGPQEEGIREGPNPLPGRAAVALLLVAGSAARPTAPVPRPLSPTPGRGCSSAPVRFPLKGETKLERELEHASIVHSAPVLQFAPVAI